VNTRVEDNEIRRHPVLYAYARSRSEAGRRVRHFFSSTQHSRCLQLIVSFDRHSRFRSKYRISLIFMATRSSVCGLVIKCTPKSLCERSDGCGCARRPVNAQSHLNEIGLSRRALISVMQAGADAGVGLLPWWQVVPRGYFWGGAWIPLAWPWVPRRVEQPARVPY
jgi:hypothetical protein